MFPVSQERCCLLLRESGSMSIWWQSLPSMHEHHAPLHFALSILFWAFWWNTQIVPSQLVTVRSSRLQTVKWSETCMHNNTHCCSCNLPLLIQDVEWQNTFSPCLVNWPMQILQLQRLSILAWFPSVYSQLQTVSISSSVLLPLSTPQISPPWLSSRGRRKT